MEMQSRYNDPKDCNSCKKESLLPANKAAWELYQIVRMQFITGGMDGAIFDINQCAVIEVLKLYNCYDVDTFEKILLLSRLDVERIARLRAAEYEKSKKK